MQPPVGVRDRGQECPRYALLNAAHNLTLPAGAFTMNRWRVDWAPPARQIASDLAHLIRNGAALLARSPLEVEDASYSAGDDMARTIGFRQSVQIGFTRLSIAILATAIGGVATAQTTGKPPPPPREVTLKTGDKVEIAAVYYASDRGKETIPIILLHEYGGSGADFKGLAEYLQREGFAVLVPDLRGHGGSTKTESGRELDHKKMLSKMFHAMYVQGGDVDVCKEFLRKENNHERLNIDKLCIVGAGLGATVAMNWAIVDWAWPELAGVKQGQDIKAILMLSPSFNEKSVNVNAALRTPVLLKELKIYIAVGETGKAADDAKKIHKPIGVARGGTEGEELKKGLVLQPLKTNRQGTQLLMSADLKVAERIKAFIDATVGKKDAPWKERKSPLD